MELYGNLCENCQHLTVTEQKYREFISKISHEVRNPLTLIYSSLQLLEADCPDIASNTLWTQIRGDILSTIALLKDISSLNRPKQQTFRVLSVRSLLETVAGSFLAEMKNRRITFTLECSPSAECSFLSGNEIQLREALTNLLVNAADAVSDSGMIDLYANTDTKNLFIHVRDNGSGIPDTYLSTLFDAFVTHKSGGTGLGLAIVRNVAREHGGTISVCTDTTSGSSFTDFCLKLPLHLT